MNAYMRVTIRVVTGNSAAQARAVQAQLQGITRAAQQANGATSSGSGMAGIWGGAGGAAAMEKFGKNLQWTGRQLEYRFTLPLVAAGVQATRWALANDTAVTRVRKVYGDLDMPIQQVNKDVDALAKGFRALSDLLGINQDEIGMVGAAWAAAGAQGAQLLRLTRLTAETSLLGDMDLESAGKALLSIQSQYQLGVEGLTHAVALLNAVENQTKIQLPELIEFFTRAAGTARTAGIDIGELAQAAAALVPAAGSAASAGNAFKTIVSRMMAPTKDMSDLFVEMGISTADWNAQGLTAWDRLKALAVVFNQADAGQQSYASSILGSRFQITKFSQLMRDLVDPVGQAAQAMKASGDDAKNMALYHRELGILLASDPQAMKILWTQVKNLMAEAIVPLIPVIKSVLISIIGMVRWFTSLSPAIQKAALMGLLLLAALGPILAYAGAFIVLGAQVYKAWKNVALLFGLIKNSWNLKLLVYSAGRLVGLMVGYVIAGWKAIFNADNIAWAWRYAKSIAAWVKEKALALAREAFWTAVRVTSWIKEKAFLFAAWVSRIALQVAGWASVHATEAAGWIASTAIAAAGSIATFIAAGGWIPLLVIAVAAGMFVFRKQVGDAISWVIRGFGKLPQGIAAAFRVTIQVIARMIGKVRELLSWLNPFARHSPSLVENVIAGVDIIASKYASLAGLSSIFRIAAADFKAFGAATSGTSSSLEAQDIATKRADIVALDPNAGPAVDNLVASIHALEATLVPLGQEFLRQQGIVGDWERALAAANAEVDVAELSLKGLQDRAGQLADELSYAKEVLSDLERTPIAGMKDYTDAIFDNEMAQKRLRLEILRLGDAGESIDDLKSRMASLQGEIELLRGRQAELRQAGAGADILRPFDAQIAALEQQQEQIGSQIKASSTLQDKLGALQKQGEILDLEQSLKFDPLKKQIDEVSNSMEEMPFDQLLSAIQEQQQVVARLTSQWEDADGAVRQQQASVDSLRATRDAVQVSYDAERAKLDALGEAYDGVERQIQDMRTALDGLATSAKDAVDDLNGFEAAASDFEIPEDIFNIDPEAGLGSIEDLVAEWQKEIDLQFGKIDFLGSIKTKLAAMWAGVKQWFTDITPDWIFQWSTLFFLALGPAGVVFALLWNHFSGFREHAGRIFGELRENAGAFADVIRDEIQTRAGAAWKLFTDFFYNGYHTWVKPVLNDIGGAAVAAADRVHQAFSWLRDQMRGVMGGIGGAIRTGVNVGISAINWLIRGLNAVSNLIPGDPFHVNEIQSLGGGDDQGSSNFRSMADQYPGEFSAGGRVPGRGTGDTVPAWLTPKEFVMPVKAVEKYGTGMMEDIRARRFAKGGLVGPGAQKMAGGGIAGFAVGAMESAISWLTAKARPAIMGTIFAPFHAGANLAISRIPMKAVRGLLRNANDGIYDWIKGGAVGMARGGIARHRAGGVLANIAEKGRDEAVVPLPHGFDSKTMGTTKTTNHFHGDLVFPNITSGDDAEEFLHNLESLVA